MVPMETTGLDGGSRMTSVSRSASRTPGAGVAESAPIGNTARAGTAACIRTQYSWKCTARRPDGSESSSTTMWVSTRSSLIGSNVTPGPWTAESQRSQSAAVTAESG
jgi:hypothetical protein